jgi:uncharacterized membrane protein YccC
MPTEADEAKRLYDASTVLHHIAGDLRVLCNFECQPHPTVDPGQNRDGIRETFMQLVRHVQDLSEMIRRRLESERQRHAAERQRCEAELQRLDMEAKRDE